MLSKVLLIALFAALAVAAPAPSMRDLRPKSGVPCTSVISPGGINPAPSSSVILLNGPSDAGRIAGPQGTGSPPVINLNPPAPSPSVINLNAPGAPPSIINLKRRQLSSLPPTSTFSFGGIVPSNAVSSTPLSSGTPAASSLPSFSSGGIVASSSSAPVSAATANPGASNSTSTFSSTGPDGVKTVLLLSTVTVSGAACSSAPAFNPSQASVSPPASSPVSLPISSSFNSTPSAFGANIQAPSPAPLSNPSIINLNSPSATITSAPGFSFSSAPAASVAPAV